MFTDYCEQCGSEDIYTYKDGVTWMGGCNTCKSIVILAAPAVYPLKFTVTVPVTKYVY